VPPYYFAAAAREIGIDLDTAALHTFAQYRDLILEAAEHFNLTAVRDPEAIERRLFLDSLALAAALSDRGLLPTAARVLDIGSGAGLPGLPVRVARPDLHVTLLEATSKRCEFLREAIEALGLEHTAVVEGRAEELARNPALRGAFDLVLARAVAPLPVLIEYSLPFLRAGGHLASSRGGGAEREAEEAARALEELGGRLVEVAELPVEDLTSALVLIEKTRPTPERYPRRTGIPSKRPLR
jgi:16S rRNA (guanine527-N7)-methyltransferase